MPTNETRARRHKLQADFEERNAALPEGERVNPRTGGATARFSTARAKAGELFRQALGDPVPRSIDGRSFLLGTKSSNKKLVEAQRVLDNAFSGGTFGIKDTKFLKMEESIGELSSRITAQKAFNDERRNRLLAHFAPRKTAQQTAIRANQQISTGRKKRQSSTIVPRLAALLGSGGSSNPGTLG